MPNIVRVSRLQVTSVYGNRIRVSRLSATPSSVAAVGNRLRVSRLSVGSGFQPTNVNRVRVSRLRANATTVGPGVFAWVGGQIRQARAYMWLSGQIVPITTPSSVVLPPNPPNPTDVYGNTYTDTY